MHIESYQARVMGCLAGSPVPYLDSFGLLSGYPAAVRCYPQQHHVVLAEHPDEGIALVAMEDERWEADLRREGWTILFHITNYVKQKASDGGTEAQTCSGSKRKPTVDEMVGIFCREDTP